MHSINGIELDDSFFLMVEAMARGVDFNKLRLRHHGDAIAQFAITQAEARHKAHKKLGGFADYPQFIFPNSLAAEQATNASLARYHASLVGEGKSVVDLTAGLGIDAMSIAARNRVMAFDIKPENVDALRHNSVVVGVGERIDAVCGDSIGFLSGDDGARFDVAFIDPARRGSSGRRVYALADCEPDVVQNLGLIMSHCSRLIIKASPMLDISLTLSQLPGAEEVHLVGTPTECKELLVVVGASSLRSQVKIIAATIGDDGRVMSVETAHAKTGIGDVACRPPSTGDFIHEPFPALMKMSRPDVVSARWPVSALAASTHLFLSSNPITDFYGRSFRVETIVKFDKQGVKSIQKEFPKANVAVRNFPLSAPELVKKLRIAEGGDVRLYGAKCADGGNYLIACRPVSKESD